jgi:hypothetical protein
MDLICIPTVPAITGGLDGVILKARGGEPERWERSGDEKSQIENVKLDLSCLRDVKLGTVS